MKELFLIYVNYVGKNHEDDYLYEFMFSDNIQGVDGEDWDFVPASNRPKPPHEKHIKKIMLLESELKLDLIQQSDTFCVWDSVDGIICLSWESVNAYDKYPEYRMSFRYGESIKNVEDKLYERDLALKAINNETTKK
jgi:hypothetical protein